MYKHVPALKVGNLITLNTGYWLESQGYCSLSHRKTLWMDDQSITDIGIC